MIVLSKETVEAYERRMAAAAVPEEERPFYLRWVRFYLDFCQKYDHAPREDQSVGPFLAKLKSKGQSNRELMQAGGAVDLLLRRGKERRRGDSRVMKGSVVDGESAAATVGRKGDVRLSAVLTPGGGQGASWEKEYRELEGAIRLRNYSPKTHDVYRMWMERFQNFTRSKAPEGLDGEDAKRFLTDLAVRQNVAGSTQNQAFNALLFFYRHVLQREFGKLDGVVRVGPIRRTTKELTWARTIELLWAERDWVKTITADRGYIGANVENVDLGAGNDREPVGGGKAPTELRCGVADAFRRASANCVEFDVGRQVRKRGARSRAFEWAFPMKL